MHYADEKSKGSKKLPIWVYKLKTGLTFFTTTPVIWGEDGSFIGTVTLQSGSVTGEPSLVHDFTCNKEQLEHCWWLEQTIPVEQLKEYFGLEVQPDPASGNQSGTTGQSGPTKDTEAGSGDTTGGTAEIHSGSPDDGGHHAHSQTDTGSHSH